MYIYKRKIQVLALQVGKSLLINKMRRLKPGAAEWAPTGVKETTLRPGALEAVTWGQGFGWMIKTNVFPHVSRNLGMKWDEMG